VLETAEHPQEAQRFARFLVDRRAQEYFANNTFEYPLADGVEPVGELPPLEELVGPDVALAALGEQLEPTLKLLGEVGLTS
jgi:iron(III) transport system substrate-binding protein